MVLWFVCVYMLVMWYIMMCVCLQHWQDMLYVAHTPRVGYACYKCTIE